jgi:FKBP12-rapamycin complex-associated protein
VWHSQGTHGAHGVVPSAPAAAPLFCAGKLLHIDFGDCFEASMHREKFPERVPFRLTRMMVKAMEVSGIEGNFRWACLPAAPAMPAPRWRPPCEPGSPHGRRATCNEVMRVLRSNKESVMAMLEAFVHDPLINWRLLNTVDNIADSAATPITT